MLYRVTILDGIVVKGPATVTLLLYSRSQDLVICDSVHTGCNEPQCN